MKNYRSALLVLLVLMTGFRVMAQQGTVKGTVTENDPTLTIKDVRITDHTGTTLALSGENGEFSFSAEPGEMTLYFYSDGYQQYILQTFVKENEVTDLGMVKMVSQQEFRTDLPTLNLNESDSEDGLESQAIHGLLSSSSDIFVSTAAYTFGQARFQIRGYDSKYSDVIINGFLANDAESGSPIWSNWGGLNDVMRNSVVTVGPEPDGNGFEPVGGISRVITNASEYRKGIKSVYSLSNRTYGNRAMVTYSTGLLENNWAFTGSYSRRWSQEGFVEGTFYDANSFFFAAEKIINQHHSLNLTALDAMYSRGVGGGSTQEAYDLTGSNYYNPYWGYQNGGKRNSRVRSSNKPLLTLSHNWNLSEKTNIKTTAGYWFGKGGYTAINWYDSEDPRPDYYRKLPSYYTDPADQERIAASWSDPSVSQVNWAALYQANWNNPVAVENADGITGNTVTGLRSQYIVEDRRNDISQFQFNTHFTHKMDLLTLTGGVNIDIYTGKNFNVIEDLLGGDFWVDIDQFAERDFPDDPDAIQNDLNHPNRIVREGDIYSHNYSSHQNQ
ncbi:MAG: TonB-dependent receptor, partial [Bacteroidales bacterium]